MSYGTNSIIISLVDIPSVTKETGAHSQGALVNNPTINAGKGRQVFICNIPTLGALREP